MLRFTPGPSIRVYVICARQPTAREQVIVTCYTILSRSQHVSDITDNTLVNSNLYLYIRPPLKGDYSLRSLNGLSINMHSIPCIQILYKQKCSQTFTICFLRVRINYSTFKTSTVLFHMTGQIIQSIHTSLLCHWPPVTTPSETRYSHAIPVKPPLQLKNT